MRTRQRVEAFSKENSRTDVRKERYLRCLVAPCNKYKHGHQHVRTRAVGSGGKDDKYRVIFRIRFTPSMSLKLLK